MKSYDISVPHFYNLVYEEKNKKMIINIDFRDPILYLDSTLITHWEAPFENEIISKEEKIKILKNIYKYLRRHNSSGRVFLNDGGI